MWWPACGEEWLTIESTCMLMVCMMKEHWNKWKPSSSIQARFNSKEIVYVHTERRI